MLIIFVPLAVDSTVSRIVSRTQFTCDLVILCFAIMFLNDTAEVILDSAALLWAF